jgi:hypothetical protein
VVVGERGDTARVYAQVRDFPIYLSHIDENTRMWFAPWRIWDGATALAGVGLTVWATWHWLDSGAAAVIFVVGAAVTTAATWLARQIPVSRPTPLYRLLWLAGCVVGTQRRTVGRPRR